jgi:antitoxin component YwqK of YwqJK toxin-antitoxin module
MLSVFALALSAYAAKVYAPNEYTLGNDGVYRTMEGKPLTGSVMQQRTENGQQVIAQFDVKKGALDQNGKMLIYWGTGELMHQANLKNGKWHGTRYEYYKNGKVKWEEQFDEGLHDGKQLLYYESGDINTEMNYDDDVLDGRFKVYARDGSLQLEASYDDGKVTKGACMVAGKKVALTQAELANWNNTQRLPACGR